MSKERLEEIKYKLYTLHNCTDTDEAIKDFIFYHLKIEWIIEQAERVQELERANKQLERQAPGIELELLNMELTDALKQNKRYREAINFAIDYLKNSDIRQVQLVVTGLKSALEESK